MKTNLRLIVLLGFFMTLSGLSSFSQVIISSDNSSAHSSAMLEVKSTDKGFLPPRVALTAITAADPVVTPAVGLLVYNTATAGTSPNNVIPGFYYWNGTIWISLVPPQGTNPGDMIYWGGSQWVVIPAGSPGKFLQLSQSNLPAWNGNAYSALTTTDRSSVTAISAVSGGNITSDGGSNVTARGVCWSKSPNPTIADSKTIDGQGLGIYSSSITGLELYTMYYVRAYATNSVGTSYGNEISFRTLSLGIGSTYQGGKIAYILQPGDPGYIAGQQHGFIAAPGDQSTGIAWYSGGLVTGATATALGTGSANTNTIVTIQGAGSYAARLCYDLEAGGYTDWYLPSKDELHKLFLSFGAVDGLVYNGFYWSSSEIGIGSAWSEQFVNPGYQYNYDKNNTFRVRAIRSF
jgi:hypothetical protein